MQVFGEGPKNVVLFPSWFSNVEAIWDLRPAAIFLERLSSFSRVIMFDRRGTGLSDPAQGAREPFFEQTTAELLAVLDAVDLAEHIVGARLVELPGDDHLFYVGDTSAIADEIEEVVTGARGFDGHRVLATILFTDIVDSTAIASRLGDRRWREVLDAHDDLIADRVTRFEGHLVKTTGDGVVATFTGPTRAARCAMAILEGVTPLGLSVRFGLHTGEIEQRENDITGLSVVIARRICDLGQPGQITASQTLADLVVGSELRFEMLGSSALKGVPGEWRLVRLLP